MTSAEKILKNYTITASARRAAVGLVSQRQGGSPGKQAQAGAACAGAPRYPKGRCLVRGIVTEVYYGEQHMHHEARLRMKVKCEKSGFIVVGAVPTKLQKPRVKVGDRVQFFATFPETCTSSYAYFTHPRVADTRYDLLDCFTQKRGVK